jgi:hypothetical protein
MIIYDFNIVGVIVSPVETDPPLVIDSNGILPAPIPFELFQPIGRRHLQIFQARCAIEHAQFAQSDPLKIVGQPFHPMTTQQPFGSFILE